MVYRGGDMGAAGRIAKNTFVLTVGQVLNLGLGFLYTIYIARYLGAEGFGLLSFALAFTGVFSVCTDLGVTSLNTREIARTRSSAGEYLGHASVIRLFLVSITVTLIIVVSNLVGYSQQTLTVVYLFSVYVGFTAFTGLFYSVFQGFEKMEYQAISLILNGVLMTAGVIVGVTQGFGVIGFAVIYSLVAAVVFVYNLVACFRKCVTPHTQLSWSFGKTMLLEALPFGLSAAFATVYYYVDSVILFSLKGDVAIGLYTAIYKLVYTLSFFPNLYFAAVFPVMSQLFVTSHSRLQYVYERSLKLMVAIILPVAVGTTLLADKVVLLVYGSEYSSSVIILQVLVWGVFFSYLNWTPVTTLNAMNRQRTVTKVVFLSMVLNVGLNLLLIPPLSYVGASVVMVLTEFLIFILLFLYARRFFDFRLSIRSGAKLACSTGVAAGVAILCSPLGLAVTALSAAATYSYPALLVAFPFKGRIITCKKRDRLT